MSYKVEYSDTDQYGESANEYDEERKFLRISHNGKILKEILDGGEPEDNYWFRDHYWVKEELERAYNLGYQDGNTSELEVE